MNIIVCLDDKNGMLFNKRRQSSDIRLIDRIMEITSAATLLTNSYSAKQFSDNIIINENFLNIAKAGEYCFVENCDIKDYKEKIEKIIIYRWNRVYPADMFFPIEILEGLKLASTYEFKGNSHEKITEEIYAL